MSPRGWQFNRSGKGKGKRDMLGLLWEDRDKRRTIMPSASSLRAGSRRGKHRENRVINRKTRMCRLLANRGSSGKEAIGCDK